jgi:cell division protein FtsW (lipid II flippase)
MLQKGVSVERGLLVSMIVCALFWYFFNFFGIKLAMFTGADGTKMRVRRLDNTVGYLGSNADLRFPAPRGSKSKRVQGFFNYSVSGGEWKYIPKNSSAEQVIPDGAATTFFGQEVEFASYLGEKGKGPADFCMILMVIMCLLSAAFQVMVFIQATSHYPADLKHLSQWLLVLFVLGLAFFIIGLTNAGPENIFINLLSFVACAIFPSENLIISTGIGWFVLLALPFILESAFPYFNKDLLKRPGLKIRLTIRNLVSLLAFAVVLFAALGKGDYVNIVISNIDIQVTDLPLLILMVSCVSSIRSKPADIFFTGLLIFLSVGAMMIAAGENGMSLVMILVLLLIASVRVLPYIGLNSNIAGLLLLVSIFAVTAGFGAIVEYNGARNSQASETPAAGGPTPTPQSESTTQKIAKRLEYWKNDYPLDATGDDRPIQVERLRITAASGGYDGFGPMQGEYRSAVLQAQVDLSVGVVLEEFGLVNGSLLIAMVFLVAIGYCFHGARAYKFHYALMCYTASFFIAVKAFINFASSTGMAFDIGPLRIGMPIVGVPMPFLARAGGSVLILFVCLSFAEASKVFTKKMRRYVKKG